MVNTDSPSSLVARLHGVIAPTVLIVTGGGFAAVTDLLTVPGASRTVLDVAVPYSSAALDAIVPGVDAAVSLDTARAMAGAAARRGHELAPDAPVTVGLACTAALVTDRPKRGDHRAHVAVERSDGGRSAWTLEMAKGERDRVAEDRLVADLVLLALAEPLALDVQLGLAPARLLDGDRLVAHHRAGHETVADPDVRETRHGS